MTASTNLKEQSTEFWFRGLNREEKALDCQIHLSYQPVIEGSTKLFSREANKAWGDQGCVVMTFQ
ncbi:hypothetical protein D3C84_1001010 [compost metagenome]